MPCTGVFLLPVALSLEVSVGKATTIYAVNGTEILLPCTFSSCFGFENLRFWWTYNASDSYRKVSRTGWPAFQGSHLRLSRLPFVMLCRGTLGWLEWEGSLGGLVGFGDLLESLEC